MTFEPATGLIVNTRSGKVHQESCTVLTNVGAAGMGWFTEWRGVARSDADAACRVCLPGGLPAVARTRHRSPAHHRRDGGDVMSDPIDTAALRAVAEAATQREWMSASDNKRKDGIALVGIAELRGQGGRGCIAVLAGSGDAIKDRHANAAHIATFDPPTVLALLDALDRQREELAGLRARADEHYAHEVFPDADYANTVHLVCVCGLPWITGEGCAVRAALAPSTPDPVTQEER